VGQASDEQEIITAYLNHLRVGGLRYMLMPLGATQEELQQTTPMVLEMAIRNGWRFTPRVHIDLFGSKPGRVACYSIRLQKSHISLTMEPIEGKILGKQVGYPQQYTPEILVAVPRSLNREIYQLNPSLIYLSKGWMSGMPTNSAS
jgi:hypothetical protein